MPMQHLKSDDISTGGQSPIGTRRDKLWQFHNYKQPFTSLTPSPFPFGGKEVKATISRAAKIASIPYLCW